MMIKELILTRIDEDSFDAKPKSPKTKTRQKNQPSAAEKPKKNEHGLSPKADEIPTKRETRCRMKSDDALLTKAIMSVILKYEKPMENIINQNTTRHLKMREIEKITLSDGVRTMGTCHIPFDNDKICRLTFSRRLNFYGNDDNLRDVICHEMLHAFLPMREGHGKAFKFLMGKLNEALKIHISVHSNVSAIKSSEVQYKYKVTCTSCGNATYYLRAGNVVRHPKKYICAKCGCKKLLVDELQGSRRQCK